ncbi:hypothetical protein P7C70_g2128, partial [Phenoliferia sp. Uapishka_3]
MSDGWSLTESDPGVFTGLLAELGVKGLEVSELWGLDAELLNDLKPVHALIFLFKWIGNGNATKPDGTFETPDGPHYFAHQVINNACASIAILNATMNIRDPNVQLGEELENLKAFSDGGLAGCRVGVRATDLYVSRAGLDPETRGWTISNSEKIREVHNSFARSDPYSLEESRPQTEDEDAYHFITYCPIGDKLCASITDSALDLAYIHRDSYELDGLKNSPVSHGIIPGGAENWTTLAKEVLERRIATHPPGEVHFNLMAITSRPAYLARRVEELSAELAKGTPDALVESQLEDAKERLARVQAQFKEWEVHRLALELAKQNKLAPQIEVAKEEMKRKLAEKKAKGQSDEEAMDDVVDG